MRTLKVTGTGNLSQSPDFVVVNFTIVSEGYDYDDVIRDINRRTGILRSDIVKAGFKYDDLKTTSYNVDTKYRRVNEEAVFDGYRATTGLLLEFDFNREELNNLIRILASSEAKAQFYLNFEVKDKEEFKRKLLTLAVVNAKDNAKTIALSANIKLGKILNINYDTPHIMYRSNLQIEHAALKASDAIDIVPSDVKEQDRVIIEWEIEDILK